MYLNFTRSHVAFIFRGKFENFTMCYIYIDILEQKIVAVRVAVLILISIESN